MSKLFTTDISGEIPIRMGVPACEESNAKPMTVFDVFKSTVARFGDNQAVSVERGEGNWKHWTYREYYSEVVQFGQALLAVGFKPFECVNIVGFNSPEWFFADLGAIAVGGVAAGIYTTNSPDACHYVAEHSDCAVVVVENKHQLDKFIEIQDRLPKLKAIVVYNEDSCVPEDGAQKKVPIYTYNQFIALGKDVSAGDVEERIAAQKPGQCCTLIYTSGTTGQPKAVMISHDNITWTSSCVKRDFLPDMTDQEHTISFLPLSHIAAQMLDIHSPLMHGYHVWFAQPTALKGTLLLTLKHVRPTFFFGVPRVWEKFYEKLMAVGRESKGLKKKISTWAKGKGADYTARNQYGGPGGAPGCFGLANAILSKVHQQIGLDRCRACFTGAAPISKDILNYFGSLNVPIYELYGMSECTGPQTVNSPGRWKIGTIGMSMAGTELKIAEGTGEIIYRGRHVLMGYLKNEEATAKTIDDEGFLHSGDVGEVDQHGFVKITGRIKELLITAGGENVAPVLIEEAMKSEMLPISNCMTLGDRQKYLALLIAVKSEVDSEGLPLQALHPETLLTAKQIGSSAKTVEDVASCPKFKEYFDKGVAAANEKAISRAQRIAKWNLLPEDFSQPGGELTPTLKLMRPKVMKKYADLIEQIYAE